MVFGKIFGKKKKVKEGRGVEERKEVKEESSLLRRICGKDEELYQELARTLYLDPRNLGTSEEALKKAEECRQKGDVLQEMFYLRHALSLCFYEIALYGGSVERIGEICERLNQLLEKKYVKIVEEPEKAVEVARKYYVIKLRETEKTKKTSYF